MLSTWNVIFLSFTSLCLQEDVGATNVCNRCMWFNCRTSQNTFNQLMLSQTIWVWGYLCCPIGRAGCFCGSVSCRTRQRDAEKTQLLKCWSFCSKVTAAGGVSVWWTLSTFLLLHMGLFGRWQGRELAPKSAEIASCVYGVEEPLKILWHQPALKT